jgi:hypothetical protein
MRIADVRGLSCPATPQPATPLRALTDAGLVSKGLPVTWTVGPGRRVVMALPKPSRLERNLLFTILMKPGEHWIAEVAPPKFGKAVPVTIKELVCPCGVAKFQNLLMPYRPGRASSADGPLGAVLGFPPKQLWHSCTLRAPTCCRAVKKAGAKGKGTASGVWSTYTVKVLLITLGLVKHEFG